MGYLFDSISIGIIDAAPFVLASMGFTLIYYLSGFINVAFAENLTMGAYLAVVFNDSLGLPFFVAIAPAALLTGGASVASYGLVFRPAFSRGMQATELIILSVGLGFFIRFGIVLIFGQDPLAIDPGTPRFFRFGGQGATSTQLVALLLVGLLTAGLLVFMYRSSAGEMMRGLADNEDLAMASGINPARVSVLVWFIAGAAGGLAGTFLGVFSVVTPRIGFSQILVIIMIVIVGGIGSVRGALIVSIATGIATAAITLLTEPAYGRVALLLLFIVVLRLRKSLGKSGG